MPSQDSNSEQMRKLEEAGFPPVLRIDRRAIPQIKELASMHFPAGESMKPIGEETTTPAGVIVPVDASLEAEPVPETDTQLLRRLLAEGFGPSSDDGCWQITEDRLNDIRKLAARIETNYAVYLLRYVLQTVFNDEIKRNSAFMGQIGSKVQVREQLLGQLGKGIQKIIEDCENSK